MLAIHRTSVQTEHRQGPKRIMLLSKEDIMFSDLNFSSDPELKIISTILIWKFTNNNWNHKVPYLLKLWRHQIREVK